jgi:hypothetical protein
MKHFPPSYATYAICMIEHNLRCMLYVCYAIYAMQSMLNNAIYATRNMLCNQCYAINAMQLKLRHAMLCNLWMPGSLCYARSAPIHVCDALYDMQRMQSMLCKLCYAIWTLQSVRCMLYVFDALYDTLRNLCDANDDLQSMLRYAMYAICNVCYIYMPIRPAYG